MSPGFVKSVFLVLPVLRVVAWVLTVTITAGNLTDSIVQLPVLTSPPAHDGDGDGDRRRPRMTQSSNRVLQSHSSPGSGSGGRHFKLAEPSQSSNEVKSNENGSLGSNHDIATMIEERFNALLNNDETAGDLDRRKIDDDVGLSPSEDVVQDNYDYPKTSIRMVHQSESQSRVFLQTQPKGNFIPSIFPVNEWIALQTLYNTTGGRSWHWYGTGAQWNFSSPLSTVHNPCYGRWEGIICSCNLTKPITIYKQFYPAYYGYYDDRTKPAIERVNVSCSVIKLYLNRRSLRGMIPRQIADLSNLTHLHLRSNALTGTFPSGLLSLSKLQVLLIGNNRLIGTLPTNVDVWAPSLQVIALNRNRFSSVLPSSWSTLSKIRILALFGNPLLGTLPQSWATLSQLQHLYLFSNMLQGALPQAWSALNELQELFLFSNSLRGPLPESWSVLSKLQVLFAYSNSLTGTLPQSWSSLNRLQQIYLFSNSLTGTLPPSWSSLSKLPELYLFSNSLRGTLPPSWSAMSSIQRLFMFNNALTGTFPHQWSALKKLQTLYLNSNSLRGSVPSQIGFLTSLQGLFLDNNYFTGVIPTSLFRLQSMTTLSLSVNCFAIETFTNSDLCAARSLEVLVMDGIHSASQCGNDDLFPFDTQYTYTLPQTSDVAMPLCLLSLPRLTILHVSGAGLIGNLSAINITHLSPQLTDLVLSHNYLYGSIPSVMQLRTTWSRLDLSFNRLGGTLVPNLLFSASTTTLLDVSNNRLSGAIPRGLLYTPNVFILQGNLFSCALFNTSVELPIFDPYEAQFNCNGNELNISALVWGCVFTLCALFVLIVMYSYGYLMTFDLQKLIFLLYQMVTSDASENDTTSGVHMLEASLAKVRLSTVNLALATSLMMLIYALFKLSAFKYTEVTVQGAYLISGTQLEGYTPAIVVAIFYFIVELGGYAMFRSNFKVKVSDIYTLRHSLAAIRRTHCNLMSIDVGKVWRYSLIIAANFIIVVFINGAYVAAYFLYTVSYVRLISFILSIFKVVWTQFGVSYLLSYIKPSSSKADARSEEFTSARLFTSLVVINTVIEPSLSIILVAPQCARYVFETPPTISSSFSFCLIYYGSVNSNGEFVATTCAQSSAISIAYTPPFLYSNQCSFALLTGYADVFTYTFVLVGFVVPGVLWLLYLYNRRYPKAPDSWMFSLIADVLPGQLFPVEHMRAVRTSRMLNKITNMMTRNSDKSQGEVTMVGVELAIGSAETVTPMHDNVPSKNIIGEHKTSQIASHNLAAIYHEALAASAFTIFKGDIALVQVCQVLCICVSFGVVFPPLFLLGALSLILHSLFVQQTVQMFNNSLSEASVPSVIDGMPISDIRKTLDTECRHFSSALWHCLPIPFAASFPILAFFLWEIVSVSYPTAVDYTIILPVVFLPLAFVCWQLLFRVQWLPLQALCATFQGRSIAVEVTALSSPQKNAATDLLPQHRDKVLAEAAESL